MLIAILSDIHDNVTNMRRALQHAAEVGCTRLLFLGDMTDLGTFSLMLELWKHPLHIVPGNNDFYYDEFRRKATDSFRHVHLYDPVADIVPGGNRRVFMMHEPERGAIHTAESGEYDLVLYGHTHRPMQQRCGNTILANPGEIQGRYGSAFFAIYDTDAHSLQHVRL